MEGINNMEANITDKPVTYNETNVQADFNNIMDLASTIQGILTKGSEDISADIGNNSENDAYSGDAASQILAQWENLKSTFNQFLSNFDEWYNECVANTKEALRLQEATKTVKDLDV